MRLALILFLAVCLLAACSKKKTADEEGVFERLEFTVDSTLLGLDYTVGGIRLHVPRGWLPVDSNVMQKLTGVAARDTSGMQLRPEMAYKPDEGGPMMLISRFPKAVDLAGRFVPWAGEVARVYREQRSDIRVQEQWMNLNGVEALQLYSQSAQLVHIKIILNADEPVSLDYTVPAETWPQEVRGVESSLGSLRKVHP